MDQRLAQSLLALPSDYTETQIKEAYRRRARQTHPDKLRQNYTAQGSGRDADCPVAAAAAHSFADIKEARDVLMQGIQFRRSIGSIYDLVTRKPPPQQQQQQQRDKFAESAQHSATTGVSSLSTSPKKPSAQPGIASVLMQDIHNFTVCQDAAVGELPSVELPLEFLCTGGTHAIELAVSFPCLDCIGLFCNTHSSANADPITGSYTHATTFPLEIPAGIASGSVVNATVSVAADAVAPGANRTVISRCGRVPVYRVTARILVRDAPHDLYVRDEQNNLRCCIEISLSDALFGIEMALATPNGRVVDISTHPGSVVQGNTDIVLAGEGVPMPGTAAERGALVVQVRVIFPHGYDQTRVPELRRLRGLFDQMYRYALAEDYTSAPFATTVMDEAQYTDDSLDSRDECSGDDVVDAGPDPSRKFAETCVAASQAEEACPVLEASPPSSPHQTPESDGYCAVSTHGNGVAKDCSARGSSLSFDRPASGQPRKRVAQVERPGTRAFLKRKRQSVRPILRSTTVRLPQITLH